MPRRGTSLGGGRLDFLPDHAPLPEEILVTTEQAEINERMLNRLPVSFQHVLRLIDLEGLDYREAAEVLGLPPGTIKSRLARARLKMCYLYKQFVLL